MPEVPLSRRARRVEHDWDDVRMIRNFTPRSPITLRCPPSSTLVHFNSVRLSVFRRSRRRAYCPTEKDCACALTSVTLANSHPRGGTVCAVSSPTGEFSTE